MVKMGCSDSPDVGAATSASTIPEASGEEALQLGLDGTCRHGCSLLGQPKEEHRGMGQMSYNCSHGSQQLRFENGSHQRCLAFIPQVTALILYFVYDSLTGPKVPQVTSHPSRLNSHVAFSVKPS